MDSRKISPIVQAAIEQLLFCGYLLRGIFQIPDFDSDTSAFCQNRCMPKIIGDSLADHRELTRNRLFDALASLLAEQPFDSISMSQIATRAKVGRTAVYNHFPDKEVLLAVHASRYPAVLNAPLEEAITLVKDPLAQLRIYIRTPGDDDPLPPKFDF